MNDACSHLSSVYPNVSYTARQRTSLTVALQASGASKEAITDAALLLASKDYATECARYMKTIPASCFLRCIEEHEMPSRGSHVSAEERSRMLDHDAHEADFRPAQVHPATRRVEQWVYDPSSTSLTERPQTP